MPRVIEFIDVNTIKKLDRYPLQPRTLNLANKLKFGSLNIHDLPPIHTVVENGCHVIKDGRHRYTAIRLAGKGRIKCKFHKS